MKRAALALLCTTLSLTAATEPVVVSRGPNHRVLEKPRPPLPGNEKGGPIRYTEIAAGMHYLKDGEWIASNATFELINGRAVARQGQHTLVLAPNIATPGAIELTTPDGQKLVSQPSGLSFMDTVTGKNVIIAEIKPSVGQQIAPNVVLYDDCFDDVDGAIRVAYHQDGVEVDVLIFDQTNLDPDAHGIPAATAQLQAWTRFTESPKAHKIDRKQGQYFDDRLLDFGGMTIVEGKAFQIGDEADSTPVQKQWLRVEDSDYLVERVDFAKISAKIRRLPRQANLPRTDRGGVAAPGGFIHRVPEIETAAIEHKPRTIESGFLLDYLTINTAQSDFVFRNDVTHYILGDITFSGVTVFEGSAILKFAPGSGSRVKLTGAIEWNGSEYAPVVMTGRDDDSVGEDISSTALSGYYADTALYVDASASGVSALLENLRIRHALTGIHLYGGHSNVVQHAQFVNCGTAIRASNSTNSLRNALAYASTNIFGLSNAKMGGEHLTVNQSTTLSTLASGATLALTNSILAQVTTLGSYTADHVETSSSGSLFQTVGEGGHYLPATSPYRASGTLAINPDLLSELRQRTTQPPQVLSLPITLPTTFFPVVERDFGPLDLGWHYSPIDLVAHGIDISTTVVFTNGVVVATWAELASYGFGLKSGAEVYSQGSPIRPNRFIRQNTVMEQVNTNWSADNYLSKTFKMLSSSTPKPKAAFRFTDFHVLAGKNKHFYNNGYHVYDPNIEFSDCQLIAGRIDAVAQGICFTNCYFERIDFYGEDSNGSPTRRFYNNLFFGGTNYIQANAANTWSLYDNHFDQMGIYQTGSTLLHGYNAYQSGFSRLTANQATDILYTNAFVYGSAALGSRYQQSTYLTDKGSRSATNAGLSHHTTLIGQTKEMTGTPYGITKATVALNGFTHTYPDDLDLLLVSPVGTTLLLLSDAGGGSNITNLTVTFDDTAGSSLPDSTALTTGTFKPTNYGSGDTFNSPAPGGTPGTTLAVFNNQNPNGTWKLYAMDDTDLDSGTLSSWTLNLTTTAGTTAFNGGSITLNALGSASPYSSDIAVSLSGGSSTNSTVDIGFHYVAVDGNGLPWDVDGDGIPDVLEDADGDGLFDNDGSESDWTTSTNGTTGSPGLLLFTPLE